MVVTGANGFIGQHLIPLLVAQFPNERIIVAIGKITKKHEKEGVSILKKLPVKIVKIDLNNKSSLKVLPKNPRVIIHLASAVDTGSTDFRANDIGTRNLLNVLNKLGKNTHIIYTSTAAIWGGRKTFDFLKETTPPDPNNEYGKTKLLAEDLLIEKSKQQKFGLTVLRLNTVYGRDLRNDKLFGMIQQMVKNKSFMINLNWPGQFGIVHVDDVVKSIITCLNYPPESNQLRTFIISTENVTMSFLSKYIHKSLNLVYKPVIIPDWFWLIAGWSRYFTSIVQAFFPVWFANLLWRVTLITNDVLKADGRKIQKELPSWKRKKFKDHAHEVII